MIAAHAPMVNATRFRQAHEKDWTELDRIVTRLEKSSARALSDDDLLLVASLYRTTLSSLSVARDTSLDRALISYLEQLCTRAYFQIYGVQTPFSQQIKTFFLEAWPAAVRALWRETLFCVIMTTAAAVLAYLLIVHDPTWFYSIIPKEMAEGRDPAATAESLRSTLYGGSEDALGVFATFLFTHNSQIAIFAFALGIAFAVPTVLLILYNGLMLGALVEVFAAKRLGLNLAAWLMIHGTTEIFAICVSGAAGIRIGLAVAFPGSAARMDAAVEAGRLGATVMAGTVIMLAVAGLLEGVGRQIVKTDGLRALIGIAVLAGWLLYFYLWRRRGGDGAD